MINYTRATAFLLFGLATLPSVIRAHINIAPSVSDSSSYGATQWYFQIPSVAYNFRFQDAKFKASGWPTDLWMSGRPYYYDLEHGYTRQQLRKQRNSSEILLAGLQRVPLLGPDAYKKDVSNQEREYEDTNLYGVFGSSNTNDDDDDDNSSTDDWTKEQTWFNDDVYLQEMEEEEEEDAEENNNNIVDPYEAFLGDDMTMSQWQQEEVQENANILYYQNIGEEEAIKIEDMDSEGDFNDDQFGGRFLRESSETMGSLDDDLATSNSNDKTSLDVVSASNEKTSLEEDVVGSPNSPLPPTKNKKHKRKKTAIPNILVVPFRYYEDGVRILESIGEVAYAVNAQFIVLVLQDEETVGDSLKSMIFFWWNQRLASLDDYLHNPRSMTDTYGKHCKFQSSDFFFAVVSSQHNYDFEWQLLYSDPIYDFAFDDVSSIRGRDFVVACFCYGMIAFSILFWIHRGLSINETMEDDKMNRFQLIESFTSEDLGQGEINTLEGEQVDRCAICLECMPTKSKVCILPCRHVFHPACMDEWLKEQEKKPPSTDEADAAVANCPGTFYCPLCKFDLKKHLLEHRAARQELKPPPTSRVRLWKTSLAWYWRRRQNAAAQQELLREQSRSEGDLELTVEQSRGEGGDLELTAEGTPSADRNTSSEDNNEVNLVV